MRAGINVRQLFTLSLFVLALSACTSANQADLGVGTSAAAVATPPPGTTLPEATDTTTALVDPNAPIQPGVDPTLAATTPVIANVRFLPVTGAPANSVKQLAGAISSQARAAQIGIAASSATSVNYQIKGYMSALSTSSGTTVTFYWDVLGPSGERLYRINGFEKINGVSTDPWKRVNSATLNRIASRTIGGLSSWIKKRKT